MRELEAWGDVHILREIPQSNRASRTWEGELDDRRAVVKLTYDCRFAVEPGFRVARFVQTNTGVQTGMPIETLDGELVVEVGDGTLAVLEFVEGEAITSFDEGLAHAAGRLLGTVHTALVRDDAPAVPADLLEWYRTFFHDGEVSRIVDEIDRVDLTTGLVYGDPSPEILRTPTGDLALIDWGTPSRGPLISDVATWEWHVGDPFAPSLRDGYFAVAPTRREEVTAIPLFRQLRASLPG